MRNKRRRSSKKNKSNNIIIDHAIKTPLFAKSLNQFICEECFHTNLIIEDADKQTKVYSETKQRCNYCSKKTNQICVKDKEIAKSILEMSADKTIKEQKAFQMIKKTKDRKVK